MTGSLQGVASWLSHSRVLCHAGLLAGAPLSSKVPRLFLGPETGGSASSQARERSHMGVGNHSEGAEANSAVCSSQGPCLCLAETLSFIVLKTGFFCMETHRLGASLLCPMRGGHCSRVASEEGAQSS
jgi:hypothetical protein